MQINLKLKHRLPQSKDSSSPSSCTTNLLKCELAVLKSVIFRKSHEKVGKFMRKIGKFYVKILEIYFGNFPEGQLQNKLNAGNVINKAKTKKNT